MKTDTTSGTKVWREISVHDIVQDILSRILQMGVNFLDGIF